MVHETTGSTDARLTRAVQILLVEDSPTDALLTIEAFADAGFRSVIHRVDNGVQALAYLRQEPPYNERPRPDLVLLDWNLPRKSGREVLEEIKVDPELKSIPILVLSTSRSEADVTMSYQLHANCYIAKPVNFERFADVVRSVREFWFKTAVLPDRGS
jgi:CheY-like chemotaxis protein